MRHADERTLREQTALGNKQRMGIQHQETFLLQEQAAFDHKAQITRQLRTEGEEATERQLQRQVQWANKMASSPLALMSSDDMPDQDFCCGVNWPSIIVTGQ